MKSFSIILAAAIAVSACAPTQPVQQETPKFAPTNAVFATDEAGAEFATGQAYDTIVVRTLALDDSREIVGVKCDATGDNLRASFSTPVDLVVPKPEENGVELTLRCTGASGEEFARSIKSYGGVEAHPKVHAEAKSEEPSALGIFFAVLAESATDVATEALTGSRPSRSSNREPTPAQEPRYTSSLTILIDG